MKFPSQSILKSLEKFRRILPASATSKLTRLFLASLLGCSLPGVVTTGFAATNYYWDANGAGGGTGGSGTWDTTNPLWRQGSAVGTLGTWPTGNPSSSIAVFDSTAGAVTLDGTTIDANGLIFGDQNWDILSGNGSSKLALNGTTPTITLNSTLARQYRLNTVVELAAGPTTLTKTGAGLTVLGLGVAPTTAASGSASWTIANGGSFNIATSSNRIRLTVGRQMDLATQAVSSQFDLSGGQVAAYLESLQVGWRTTDLAGAATANVTATADFGTHSSSILNLSSTSSAAVIGYLEINNATGSYTGSVAGTLNLGGGTNTITSNHATAASVIIGQATTRSFTANTNGSNVASATGIWNLTGGTTTVSSTGSINAIALAMRDSQLGVNTTVSGALNLTGGTLNVSGGDLYGGGGTSTVTLNGGTLNLNGRNLGRSGGLITNLNFQSGTLSNVNQINNGADLVKTTVGTLVISGTNTYTGATRVNAGTLLVNGSLAAASAVSVGGATASGTPTLGGGIGAGNGGSLHATVGSASRQFYNSSASIGSLGAVTVRGIEGGAAGHLAPGNSVGTLTMTALTLNSGSLLDFEFNGVANDFLSITGTNSLTLNGGAFNLFVEGTSNPFTTSGTYLLMSYQGTLLSDLSALSVNGLSAAEYNFSTFSNSGVNYLQLQLIPEPSSLALLVGAGILLYAKRKSKIRE